MSTEFQIFGTITLDGIKKLSFNAKKNPCYLDGKLIWIETGNLRDIFFLIISNHISLCQRKKFENTQNKDHPSVHLPLSLFLHFAKR